MNLLRPSLTQLRQASTSRVVNNLCWPKPDYGPMEVQRSVLMNGIKVAAAKPLGAPIAACTIMYQVDQAPRYFPLANCKQFAYLLVEG